MVETMVYFGPVVANKKYAPYAIGLPNNITCWHFHKKGNLLPSEAMHLILITAKNRTRVSDIYVTSEIEKGWLELPAKHKRRIAGKLAALRRKERRS